MPLEEIFQDLKARREGGVIAFLTGGDPTPEATPELVEAMVEGGADIVELGVPFSDPIADGPTIQAANIRALKAGTTPLKVLEMAEEAKRRVDARIVLLTYYNPVYRIGLGRFMKSASKHGIEGFIVPDLPIEESASYRWTAESYGLDTIFLATPSTPEGRLKEIARQTSGFLYLVALHGVTGAREKLDHITLEALEKISRGAEDRPAVAVGFGISKPEHVKAVVNAGADAAIVGSAIIKLIEKNLGGRDEMAEAIKAYVEGLKRAAKPSESTLSR
ncbi:MAG: tryptophan synthase subunit alpha [Candidatus Bathyarchaeia archaeon]